jgi:hypothetical protein
MFCPNCGVEYRPGFTHCNDCDVDLVEELPAEGEPAEGEAEGEKEALELLWRGTQGGVFNAIAGALDEAGIRYNREKLDARLTFSSGYAPLDVWVPAAQLDAARKVLDETLAQIAQPIQDSDSSSSYADSVEGEEWSETPGIVEEPHPEDATAEVWKGDEEAMGQFLKSCLAANGIGCYVDSEDPKAVAVRVLPEEEARAHEIVRQVVEGIPPA